MAFVLVVMTIFATACSGAVIGSSPPTDTRSPTPGAAGTGIVQGIVLSRPCSGGPESLASPCPGLPVPDADVVFTAAGDGSVLTTATDADGRYSLSVPAGAHDVTVQGREFYVDKGPRRVDVVAGSATTVDLVIDSGLR